MVFTGTYAHTIDAKQRLAIPAEIRSQICGSDRADETYVYVTLGEDGALCIYTDQGFEQRAEELDQSEMDYDELQRYELLFYSLSRRVKIDKQGRIQLPDHLLKRTKIGTEVVLIGGKDHVEVRDRESWLAYVDRTLKENPKLLMNPRRAMRKKRTDQG